MSDKWGIADKLKKVSVEAIEKKLAEAISNLAGESSDQVKISIEAMDFGDSVSSVVNLKLSAWTPFTIPWAAESKLAEDTADSSATKKAVPPPEGEAWTREGDDLLAFALKLASPAARDERLERALVYYGAALGVYPEDRFPEQRRILLERIARAENFRKGIGGA